MDAWIIKNLSVLNLQTILFAALAVFGLFWVAEKKLNFKRRFYSPLLVIGLFAYLILEWVQINWI